MSNRKMTQEEKNWWIVWPTPPLSDGEIGRVMIEVERHKLLGSMDERCADFVLELGREREALKKEVEALREKAGHWDRLQEQTEKFLAVGHETA